MKLCPLFFKTAQIAIITFLSKIILPAQALEIITPKAGDRIDLQHGLKVSWIVEDSDNLTANVNIKLMLDDVFQVGLTWSEPGGTVPINESSYIFQYTPDKSYISPGTDYAIYLNDGNSTYESPEFEIFNTQTFVPSASILQPQKPTATKKDSKKSPSPSASASVMVNSTSTRLPHHRPSASSGRTNGFPDGNINGTMGFVLIGGPLLWGLILVYVQGGLIWT